MTQMIVTFETQFTPWQHLLRERLHTLLDTLAPPLRVDVVRALETEGKLFWRSEHASERPAGVWGLLTLLVALHLSPDTDRHYATKVAVAVECYICALDILDDIEDSDRTAALEELGVARGLSVATTLLFLAQRALLDAGSHVAPEQALRLIAALSDASLAATSGQHRDILSEHRPVASVSPQECMEILAAKSGSLMSLACRLGALCAESSDAVCEAWTRLGHALGIAHQLDNDAHDFHVLAAHQEHPGAGKATRGVPPHKKTLPIVLAAQILAQLRGRSAPANPQEHQVLQDLALQEAVVITSGRAILCRERVRDAVLQLETERPLSPALHRLLGV